MPKTIIHELSADNDPVALEQTCASGFGHQLALLSQMVEEISGELALEPLLNRIVERACKLIGADDGVIDAMTPAQMTQRIDFTAYRQQALEHEEALLRICQEAAYNAIRHSGAVCRSIVAGSDDDQAWLSIDDDGRGVSGSTPPSMGIANMWQRMLVLERSLHIAARTPHGTYIEARLPRRDRQES